jgi:hypothetical protein
MFLQSFGIYLQVHTLFQVRRPTLSSCGYVSSPSITDQSFMCDNEFSVISDIDIVTAHCFLDFAGFDDDFHVSKGRDNR